MKNENNKRPRLNETGKENSRKRSDKPNPKRAYFDKGEFKNPKDKRLNPEERENVNPKRRYNEGGPKSRFKKTEEGRSQHFSKSSSSQKDPKNPEANLKKVYRGRGKDENPVYDWIPADKVEHHKKRFKKPFVKPSKEERPDYNFDKLEQSHRKKGKSEEIRLNKYISNAGICSRREADTLIEKGLVQVNGSVVNELGFKVSPGDKVHYKGKLVNPEKPVYLLLNKPKDFITTTEDPLERKTVMNLIANACEERVFPVGRLDRNTTGLLFFTNDGDLAAKLSHPSNNIKKIYQVTLDKALSHNDEKAISEGIQLEDGLAEVDDIQVLSKDRKILGLEIHLGRNRIVRRIFAQLGYEVVGLDRVMYAGLDKKDLPRGRFRFLSEKEVIRLKYFL
jgi:23S rRNA pseudouridine2605 synthase